MTDQVKPLLASLLALVLLTTIIGFRMLFCRVREMRKKRIHHDELVLVHVRAGALALVGTARLDWPRSAAVNLPALAPSGAWRQTHAEELRSLPKKHRCSITAPTIPTLATSSLPCQVGRCVFPDAERPRWLRRGQAV